MNSTHQGASGQAATANLRPAAETARLVDAEQFRAQFPALESTTHLASCSYGPLSHALTEALEEFTRTLVEQGDPWQKWLARVEEARRRFAALIGAPADEIAIVSCASEGAYQVVSGLHWAPGDTIVTSDLEFPSVAHVWLAQRSRGAVVRFAEAVDGFAAAEAYEHAIDDSARLVSIPLITYRHGQRLPVSQIIALARARGAQVFLDAYQAAGVEPIDVRELDCDYLVSGAQKYLLGVPGVAFLYVRTGTARDLDPQLTGWFGRADPFSFNPRELDYSPTARRYEIGTPPATAAYAAVAGMRTLATVEPERIVAHIRALTAHLHAELAAAGERLASPASGELRGPQVALRDHDPARLAAYLADRRIITSPRADLLRLAVHYYNNSTDIDTVLRAIADYRSM